MFESAHVAGLRHVSDQTRGIVRERLGESFIYRDVAGRRIRNRKVIKRITHLAIPPAWEEVWICPVENGHLQATGRDARWRKQYRYHANWRKSRDQTKYDAMIAFGRALPHLRARVRRDLSRRGLPREKVLATVTRLLETTLIRVGNEEYARNNGSFGLTTLQNRHVRVSGQKMTFTFRGKSGKHHVIDVENRKLASIVRHCRDLPGHELFVYRDESGTPTDVTSGDVNAYLQQVTGQPFTAKDFRTWAGTVFALQALRKFGRFTTKTEAKRNVLTAVERVSAMLGNTPAICRQCYIHPLILEAYLDGTMMDRLSKVLPQTLTSEMKGLRSDEAAMVRLLQQSLQSPSQR